MTNNELYAIRQRLNAFVGQLIDLEAGHLDELVISKSKDAELLKDILEIQISKIDADLKEEALR